MREQVSKLPEPFLERLRLIVPCDKFDAVANTFTEPKPTTFRANTLKTSAKKVAEALENQGFRLERVSWYPDAFILKAGRLQELQKTSFYQNGEIYVQSLSSMIPPLVLDPKPGEEILDLTAAPGSKTTQLACLMNGEGKIVANDNNRPRFFKLKANLELQGVRNVELMQRYGESIGRMFPERFQKILLDAPCGTEGRFYVHEPETYCYWKPAKIREMVRKQKKLLYSAVQALGTGGVLVYSTCTFAPEENEGVLDWVLEKFQGVIAIEKIDFMLPNQTSGLGAWDDETFDASVRNARRILPTAQMEGFFVVKVRKLVPVTGTKC